MNLLKSRKLMIVGAVLLLAAIVTALWWPWVSLSLERKGFQLQSCSIPFITSSPVQIWIQGPTDPNTGTSQPICYELYYTQNHVAINNLGLGTADFYVGNSGTNSVDVTTKINGYTQVMRVPSGYIHHIADNETLVAVDINQPFPGPGNTDVGNIKEVIANNINTTSLNLISNFHAGDQMMKFSGTGTLHLDLELDNIVSVELAPKTCATLGGTVQGSPFIVQFPSGYKGLMWKSGTFAVQWMKISHC